MSKAVYQRTPLKVQPFFHKMVLDSFILENSIISDYARVDSLDICGIWMHGHVLANTREVNERPDADRGKEARVANSRV